MAEQIPEIWENTFRGKTTYGAYGPRDALIIKSSDSLQGQEIVRRREGQLTQEDKDRLSNEGFPSEIWGDDAQLMQARYRKEARYHNVLMEDDPDMTVSYVMEKITSLLKTTKRPGVIISYFGPGRKNSGDWCFKDGFISFKDIIPLYEKHFIGKELGIVCDCSHSGRWVELLREYLDGCMIPPCAHYARKTGKLLFAIASCRSEEIPHTLYFSARTHRNDKNTGQMYLHEMSLRIAEGQHGCCCQNSELICGATNFDHPCKLPVAYTWEKMHRAKRLFLVHSQLEWAFFLVPDKADTIDSMRNRAISAIESSEAILIGEGNEPPAEVKEWINKEYFGNNCF